MMRQPPTGNVSEVARYLDAMSFLKRRAETAWPWGAAPFVTISREAGSSGRALADAVVESLGGLQDDRLGKGWQTFDQALIELAGREPRLQSSLRELLGEEYYSAGYDTIRQMFFRVPPQSVVLGRVFHVLRGLAGVGKVVILGRGGAVLTHDLPGGVHIRLVASRRTRAQRLNREWKLDERRAEKKMDELDASRAKLIRDHFGVDPADPRLYDAVFNVDRVELSSVAEWVVDRVQKEARVLVRRHAAGR
jgi:hypothetical protein